MRWGILVLWGILLISFTSADNHSSTTETDFNVGGCDFDFGEDVISVRIGECSSGEAFGEFFCDNNSFGWITREAGLGCSRGETTYTSGSNSCCPVGMECNATNGEFQCVRRTENCIDQENEDTCETIDCTWLNITNTCVDSTYDLSCKYYNTSELLCNEDPYNLGKNGIGTELCGTTAECQGEIFSISEEECGCKWYPLAPEGQNCQVKLVGVQMFYNETPNKFECSNSYNLEECIDGRQNVSWTSNSSVLNGTWTDGVPEDCLSILECNSGEENRFCGEPIIKLPGFSLFSLFASLGIIGLYYFSRKD